MPALDGTGPRGPAPATGRGRGSCRPAPRPEPEANYPAQGSTWNKTFWTGLANVALQYAVSYWRGGRTVGGGRGRPR